MKKLMFILALVVLLAFTGSVMAAESGQTAITANIVGNYIEVTAPETFAWSLQPSGNNEVQLPYQVNVTSNSNWNLMVSASEDGHFVSTDGMMTRYALPAWVYRNGDWFELYETPNLFASGAAATDLGMNINLRQTVTPGDKTPAAITLTFTGSIA